MSNDIILTFLVGQFIIQAVLYFTIVRPFVNKPLSTFIPKALPTAMVIENLLISVVVVLFTSAGAAAGMTNLMASVLLGIVMAIDCKVLLGSKEQKQREEFDEYFIQK